MVFSMRVWTLAEATDALPEVRRRVRRIRELVAEMRRRDEAVGGNGQAPRDGHGRSGARGTPDPGSELRDLLASFERDGVVLRDADRGLVDFPARSPSGRDFLLCWLDGEESIDWWHWPDAGFAGRTPLSDPPD